MIRKTYFAPLMEVHEITFVSLVCQSLGVGSEKAGISGDDVIDYGGDWSED